jgi:hypothetical protein
MQEILCPQTTQFHIVFEQVGSFERPHKTVVGTEPDEALRSFLPSLPINWRGGFSVFDDTVGHEDEMPLLHVTL